MGVILERKKRILLNEPHIVTTTPAGIANFSTDLIAPLKSCKVEFSPVQAGTGDPSPSNVRPISGWTGCNVWRTGKNLFNQSTFEWESSGYTIYHSLYVGNGTFTMSTNLPDNAIKDVFFLAGQVTTGAGSDINGVSIAVPITVTTVDGYVTVASRISSTRPKPSGYNWQIELGPTATTYTPYTGSTIPIDWTTEAGTVYGGYVNLVTGELVSVMGVANLGALAWSKSGNVFSANLPDAKKATDTIGLRNAICEKYKLASTGYALYTGAEDKVFLINSNYLGSQGKVYIGDSSYQTAAELKTSLSDVKLVYELATPITYQLTPTQLKSLRGVNNIWSDANGDTTAKYWTH